MRLGSGGSVVDNAHAGGIFAHIDVGTGIVDSDGITTSNIRFRNHPDSKFPIKGFKIPQWHKITQACKMAHTKSPTFIVGWDVVINASGKVEFIEGNHAPDVDLMQSPLKRGICKEFLDACKAFK